MANSPADCILSGGSNRLGMSNGEQPRQLQPGAGFKLTGKAKRSAVPPTATRRGVQIGWKGQAQRGPADCNPARGSNWLERQAQRDPADCNPARGSISAGHANRSAPSSPPKADRMPQAARAAESGEPQEACEKPAGRAAPGGYKTKPADRLRMVQRLPTAGRAPGLRPGARFARQAGFRRRPCRRAMSRACGCCPGRQAPA